jgi:hypothetical protein
MGRSLWWYVNANHQNAVTGLLPLHAVSILLGAAFGFRGVCARLAGHRPQGYARRSTTWAYGVLKLRELGQPGVRSGRSDQTNGSPRVALSGQIAMFE